MFCELFQSADNIFEKTDKRRPICLQHSWSQYRMNVFIHKSAIVFLYVKPTSTDSDVYCKKYIIAAFISDQYSLINKSFILIFKRGQILLRDWIVIEADRIHTMSRYVILPRISPSHPWHLHDW